MRTKAYDELLVLLKSARQSAGVSQRDLCKRLGQPYTYIAKIEAGDRRVDIVELAQICVELDADAQEILNRVEAIVRESKR